MSSIDLLVASPASFGADAGAGALSEYPGLYPTNDPLELGLGLDRSLPLTLPWNGQAGITWRGLNGPGNTTSTATQGDQQKSHKFEKPGNAEKRTQAQMIQTPHRHRHSKANATPDFQTGQRERLLENNRLAARRKTNTHSALKHDSAKKHRKKDNWRVISQHCVVKSRALRMKF